MPAHRRIDCKLGQEARNVAISLEAMQRQAQFSLIVSYVHAANHIAPEYVLGSSRGSQHLSRARHIVYYLSHVGFGMSYTHIGQMTMRDRTSVAHGVTRLEDGRDTPAVDRAMHFAELALAELFTTSWRASNDSGE